MDDKIPLTRTALRTLLTVLLVALGVAIYAYGWNATEINLDEVNDDVRQASVKRAMRGLLSPAIFTRDRELELYTVEFQIGCPEGELPDGRKDTEGDPYLIFSPSCAETDEVITVVGAEFAAGAIARIQLVQDSGQKLPFKVAQVSGDEVEISDEALFDVDGAGDFEVQLKVPKGRGLSGQTHTLEVQTLVPTGWPRFSETTDTVVDKMIETIFLALMATTLALPVAVGLSFFAARNLMRQVTLPLGNVLVGFVLVPVGAVLGARLLGPIGEAGVELGQDLLPGLVAAPAAIAGYAVIMAGLARVDADLFNNRLRAVISNILLLVLLVFVLGVLGGMGIWLGEKLQDGLLADLGNFVGTLGELVDMLVVAVAAAAGGFWLASVGSTLASGPLRYVKTPLSNVLGAVLGLVAGAMLFAGLAYIGMQAVLLGLLVPIVAAVLGGQIAIQLLQVIGILKVHRIAAEQDLTERTIRQIAFVVGAFLTFVLVSVAIDLIRAIVDQRLPADTMRDFGLFEVYSYVATAGVLGAILGGAAGGMAGTQTSFPLGMSVYNTARTILNTLRSIEPLIMGIVFVIWVGMGPFAGVLALTLHSVAALGKLYSEQVENIDAGPIEAIQSTGANRLQTIVYAVVPQIVPPYIAFTMYRWDINVRMSTIIGFVGGGGIGFLLQQQINLLRYRQAGVAVLAIAIVVSVLDYASAAIRERIV